VEGTCSVEGGGPVMRTEGPATTTTGVQGTPLGGGGGC